MDLNLVTNPNEVSLVLIKYDEQGANCATESQISNGTLLYEDSNQQISYY